MTHQKLMTRVLSFVCSRHLLSSKQAGCEGELLLVEASQRDESARMQQPGTELRRQHVRGRRFDDMLALPVELLEQVGVLAGLERLPRRVHDERHHDADASADITMCEHWGKLAAGERDVH